jgi:TorA maturation chaperone TorD
VGAGRAPVTPYTGAYCAPHGADRHLLGLRERLSEWGLERRQSVFELEDHVSAVCDVMRWLIERERALPQQQTFFFEFVLPGVSAFCDALRNVAQSAFYRAAADLGRVFVALEKEAFELHTPE